MSKQTDSLEKTGFKVPPKHSQFKKGRSGNPNGRPRQYDPIEAHKHAKALGELLANHQQFNYEACAGNGKRKSLSYILWLIKELEIQIRLQGYDRVSSGKPSKKRAPPRTPTILDWLEY